MSENHQPPLYPHEEASDDKPAVSPPIQLGGGWELDAESPSIKAEPSSTQQSPTLNPPKRTEGGTWGGWGWSADRPGNSGPVGC